MSEVGEIWVLAIVQVGLAILGLAGASRAFDFALGSHERGSYPPDLWRRANRLVAYGLVASGALGAVLSLLALSSEPNRRTIAIIAACWTAVAAITGTVAGLRTLSRYRRSGARWR
jgi:hypothetical protein